MYKLFLTLRYLRKRRIAYFAILAVALCTAMVLIVMSVMGGFLDQLVRKARGLLGDIIVDNRSYRGFPLYDEFIADVSQWPEIVRATPLIYSYGIMRLENSPRTSTVQVVGMRLEDVYVVNAFKQSLFYEKYYPGTTRLGPQKQPLMGLSDDPSLPGPQLPEPYRSALDQSRAAGIIDTESAETDLSAFLEEKKLAPIPGMFAFNADEESLAPRLAGEERYGIILGRDLIAERQPDGKYKRFSVRPLGMYIDLTLMPVSDSGSADTPVKERFRYADDSRTGIYEIDSKSVYVEFEHLQKLLLMDAEKSSDGRLIPARCSQIQVKIRAGADPAQVARRLGAHYRSFAGDPRFKLDAVDRELVLMIDPMTWDKSQAHLIGPVEHEKQLVTILFGIISLVAAVLVLCILYMIVLQKTRDIGIIKSIGGSSAGVAAIFLSYGAAVGVVGSAIGATLGVLFVRNINAVQDYLVWQFGWRVWDRSVYSFDEIPSTVRAFDVVVVVASAILASTLGAVVAAWRAGSMHPVESLRYE